MKLGGPCHIQYSEISDTAQIARFEEKYSGGLGVDLEMQPVRTYPFGTTAGHVLGYLQRDDSSVQGEDAFFSYRLPDYRGAVGVEAGFDAELRGRAGAEAVLVNNLGYRQTENVWSSPEPGHNVVLTLDINIEETAERFACTSRWRRRTSRSGGHGCAHGRCAGHGFVAGDQPKLFCRRFSFK